MLQSRHLIAVGLLATSGWLLWTALSPFVRLSSPSNESPTSADLYPERDWTRAEGNKSSKISVFVFRDRNRSGRYDLGDLPMASVAVKLHRPDGSTRVRRSNINGYTNFTTALSSDTSDITEVETAYDFEVMTPRGFIVTTENARQRCSFRTLPGSIGGIVANEPPESIGLAPELSITGQIAGRGTVSPRQDAWPLIEAIGPDQRVLKARPDSAGVFRVQAEPGEWRLSIPIQSSADGALERRVLVDDTPVRLSTIHPQAAQRQPLPPVGQIEDFELLQRSVIEKIPNGHGGLAWNYLLAVDNQLYQGPGYVNTLTSGGGVGYNSSGHPVTVSSDRCAEFDFIGAYFGVAWPNAHGEALQVQGWHNDNLFYRDVIPLSYLGPVWFDADYRRIDRLELSTAHYWQFVVDDMAFRCEAP